MNNPCQSCCKKFCIYKDTKQTCKEQITFVQENQLKRVGEEDVCNI